MVKNAGKAFELEFKSSSPPRLLLVRIPDPPQSFKKSDALRFSPKNPCDYIAYDTKTRTMLCLELKTTKYKSMSFEDINSDANRDGMIKRHQILSLSDFAEYDGVVSGFVFNFRDESTNIKRTYFQDIRDFCNMISHINKKSFNEIDLLSNNAVKIEGRRKIKNYDWDLESFLDGVAKL